MNIKDDPEKIVLSIIIPVSPVEYMLDPLLTYFVNHMDFKAEIIISAMHQNKECCNKYGSHLRCITGPKGRAKQLNTGAEHALGKYLWFVHADSKFEDNNIVSQLIDFLDSRKKILTYFNLCFDNDGPMFMRINELGVWFRCRFLNIPFGDQALALRRTDFWDMGGFDETLPNGEDHAFVQKARGKGMAVKSCGLNITTSARKYKLNGWFSTTLNHLWLTLKQTMNLRYSRMKK